MCCHFLLQGLFLTQGSKPGLRYCRQTLYQLSHQGSPDWGGQIKSQARAAALPLLPGQVGSSEIGPRPLQRILVGSSQAHFVFSYFPSPILLSTPAQTHILPSCLLGSRPTNQVNSCSQLSSQLWCWRDSASGKTHLQDWDSNDIQEKPYGIVKSMRSKGQPIRNSLRSTMGRVV